MENEWEEKPAEIVTEIVKLLEPTVAPLVIEKPRALTLAEVAGMFPEPELTPTQRSYGETFYPQYVKALAELKRLAET